MPTMGTRTIVAAALLAGCASAPVPAAREPEYPDLNPPTAPAEAKPAQAKAAPMPEPEAPPVDPAALERAESERAEAEAYEAAMLEHATRLGFYGVVFSRGLTAILEDLVEGRGDLAKAPGVAIELAGADDGWRADQVFADGALYLSPYSDSAVWLEAPAGATIIEGSRLDQVGGYVEVVGVRSFQALIGPRQAFVVRLAWPEAD